MPAIHAHCLVAGANCQTSSIPPALCVWNNETVAQQYKYIPQDPACIAGRCNAVSRIRQETHLQNTLRPRTTRAQSVLGQTPAPQKLAHQECYPCSACRQVSWVSVTLIILTATPSVPNAPASSLLWLPVSHAHSVTALLAVTVAATTAKVSTVTMSRSTMVN